MDAGLGLFEFLNEAELQHYYDAFKSDLKIQNVSQLKYVTDEDLETIGMSRPELRRFKKFYSKYHSHNYFSKIKRFLVPKREEITSGIITPPSPPNTSVYPDKSGNKHIIPIENITINKELGSGEFGVVQQGVWSDNGRRIQVAVKCLYPEQMHSNAKAFLKEAAIMHDIDHKYIVRLYGVALHTGSLMLVTELAPLRSLLECLKENSLRSSFPVPTLCGFAVQICEGMTYLENKRLIHRDLAARNILVFTKNIVKISDFGLSRALGAGKDYYQTNFNVNLKLPIAWCAPECISYLKFTSSSDVWAYAVTLWEMFSYGFQPWAAFSGQQILTAIDTPNCQRLERPECCPKEYYLLMLKCWAHEPTKRPNFSDIFTMLPDCKPEQVQVVTPKNTDLNLKKTEQLDYKIGDIITVLDKNSSIHWKGILNSGATGYFNPLNTVSYLGSNLPSVGAKNSFQQSTGDLERDNSKCSLIRNDKERSTVLRRKLRSKMISAPEGNVKHIGHVGIDGVYFGDISFLPKQIVTPYKPSEDLEQMPLINPNSPSHLTGNNSSLTAHSILLQESIDNSINTNIPINNASENTLRINFNSWDDNFCDIREYLNVKTETTNNETCNFNFDSLSLSKRVSKFKWPKKRESKNPILPNIENENEINENSNICETEVQCHEYQEISDDDDPKSDFEQSLLDEMELVFRNYGETSKSYISGNQDVTSNNSKNEFTELNSKLHYSSSTSKKKQTVKPISAHDQKTLDSAIALANKLTVKSMTDLEDDEVPNTPKSPNERSKFSFFFPLGGGGNSQNSITNSFNNVTKGSDVLHRHKIEKRNFSQEAQSVPDIQTSLTEESKKAYESLVEQPCRLETTLLKIKQKQIPSIQLMDKSESSMSPFINPIDNKNLLDNQEIEFQNLKINSNTHSKNVDFPNCHSSNIFLMDSAVSKKSGNSISTDTVDSTITDINTNPLPVPPRDPNKHWETGKRHVRKHPLANSTSDDTIISNMTPSFNNIQNESLKTNSANILSQNANNFYFSNQNNFNHFSISFSTLNPFDTPSLNFEAQIENNFNSIDCCDGLTPNFDFESNSDSKKNNCPFDSQLFKSADESDSLFTPSYGEETSISMNSCMNSHEINFIDDSPTSFNIFTARNETNKSDMLKYNRNNIENSQQIDSFKVHNLMQHSPDRVSVEDLLEFADQKPCGRQRGVDSDEVRIMSKVLNQQVSAENCLLALEFESWNVHRAIKLARLKFTGPDNPTFYECSAALETCEWDVVRAAAILAESSDVTQV